MVRITQTIIQFLHRGPQTISNPLSFILCYVIILGMLLLARDFSSCFTMEIWGGAVLFLLEIFKNLLYDAFCIS